MLRGQQQQHPQSYSFNPTVIGTTKQSPGESEENNLPDNLFGNFSVIEHVGEPISRTTIDPIKLNGTTYNPKKRQLHEIERTKQLSGRNLIAMYEKPLTQSTSNFNALLTRSSLTMPHFDQPLNQPQEQQPFISIVDYNEESRKRSGPQNQPTMYSTPYRDRILSKTSSTNMVSNPSSYPASEARPMIVQQLENSSLMEEKSVQKSGYSDKFYSQRYSVAAAGTRPGSIERIEEQQSLNSIYDTRPHRITEPGKPSIVRIETTKPLGYNSIHVQPQYFQTSVGVQQKLTSQNINNQQNQLLIEQEMIRGLLGNKIQQPENDHSISQISLQNISFIDKPNKIILSKDFPSISTHNSANKSTSYSRQQPIRHQHSQSSHILNINVEEEKRKKSNNQPKYQQQPQPQLNLKGCIHPNPISTVTFSQIQNQLNRNKPQHQTLPKQIEDEIKQKVRAISNTIESPEQAFQKTIEKEKPAESILKPKRISQSASNPVSLPLPLPSQISPIEQFSTNIASQRITTVGSTAPAPINPLLFIDENKSDLAKQIQEQLYNLTGEKLQVCMVNQNILPTQQSPKSNRPEVTLQSSVQHNGTNFLYQRNSQHIPKDYLNEISSSKPIDYITAQPIQSYRSAIIEREIVSQTFQPREPIKSEEITLIQPQSEIQKKDTPNQFPHCFGCSIPETQRSEPYEPVIEEEKPKKSVPSHQVKTHITEEKQQIPIPPANPRKIANKSSSIFSNQDWNQRNHIPAMNQRKISHNSLVSAALTQKDANTQNLVTEGNQLRDERVTVSRNSSPIQIFKNQTKSTTNFIREDEESFCERCCEFISSQRIEVHSSICKVSFPSTKQSRFDFLNEKILKISYLLKRKTQVENSQIKQSEQKQWNFCQYMSECLSNLAAENTNNQNYQSSKDDLELITQRIRKTTVHQHLNFISAKALTLVQRKAELFIE